MLKRHIPTPREFLVRVNPDWQIKLMDRPIAELANSASVTSLAIVAQAYSKDIAISWIEAQLKRFLEYCKKGDKETTEIQDYELSVAIYAQYYYLNVYEIAQFFGLCRTGRYGKFYGQPTPLDIMEMMQKHIQARNAELDRKDREDTAERIANQEVFLNGYTKYIEELKQRAAEGDNDAIEILKRHKEL